MMSPSDILFSAGSVTIYWYGLCVALGIAVCYAISYRIALRCRQDVMRHFDRVFALCLISGIIGARALFVLYHLQYFQSYPAEIFALWHGGWVWQGGVVVGVPAALIYCRVARVSFFTLGDIFASGIALGQAIGRIGNYFNQEAYGAPTSLPWGIPIDLAHRIPGYEWATRFHPTFAYEALINLGIAAILCGVGTRYASRYGIGSGVIFWLWILLYSVGRFGIEFLRIDTVPIILGMRAPQVLCVLFIILSGTSLFLILARKRHP